MLGAKVTSMSFRGILREINLPVAEKAVYEAYLNFDQIRNMPSYPAEGSIQEIDGRIVVKISDRY